MKTRHGITVLYNSLLLMVRQWKSLRTALCYLFKLKLMYINFSVKKENTFQLKPSILFNISFLNIYREMMFPKER